MRQLSIFLVSAVLLAGAGVSQARAADFSDPKKTVETCGKAIDAADVDAIKNCFTSADPDKQAMIAGMAKIIAASHLLQVAAVDKFGDDGKAIMGGRQGMGQNLADTIARLKDADEKIDGDTATITPKVDPNAPNPNAPAAAPVDQPLYFKKIGGDWKIDWDKQTQGMGAPQGPQGGPGPDIAKMTGVMAQAMNDTADDIKAGKFKTVDDARQGFQQRIQQAMMSMMQQMQPQPGGQ